MTFHYKEISPDLVAEEVRIPGSVALDFCREDLGLPDEIYIQWIRAVSAEDYELWKGLDRYQKFGFEFDGRMFGALSPRKNQLLIRADVATDRILNAIAHECRHIKDREQGEAILNTALSGTYRSDPIEIRANAYADQALPKIKESIEVMEMIGELNQELRALARAMGGLQ